MGLLFMQLLNHTDKLAYQSKEEAAILQIFKYIEENYKNSSLTEAAKNMSRPRQTVLPNEANRKKYAKLLELYLSIYPQFKGFFADVAKTFRSFEA